MQLGVTIRNMGPQSSQTLLRQCAIDAEAAGLESIWITDHIAIPPDDSEGSEESVLEQRNVQVFGLGRDRVP